MQERERERAYAQDTKNTVEDAIKWERDATCLSVCGAARMAMLLSAVVIVSSLLLIMATATIQQYTHIRNYPTACRVDMAVTT